MTDVQEVLAALPATSSLLVLVDFDGTLSDIVSRPDDAKPVDGAEDVLAALAARCEVAVVSGRPVVDLRRRLKVGHTVSLAGSHGTEVVHPDGTVDTLVDPEVVRGTLDTVERELNDLVDVGDGWLIERKPAAIAVHHRMVADPGTKLLAVRRVLDSHVGDEPGWVVADGKAVTELRPDGITKGNVVERLADMHPDRHLLVLGDDVTDEDAFAAARTRGGTNVVVADRSQESIAPFRVPDPATVVQLLAAIADRE